VKDTEAMRRENLLIVLLGAVLCVLWVALVYLLRS
jgi:hypothetical protein